MSIFNATKTIWCSYVEQHKFFTRPYTAPAYSTINEKMAIQHGVALPTDQAPEIKYMVIGRKGHKNVAGIADETITDTLHHRISDAVLFEHIPFVVRKTTDDLSAAERSKYRLRRLENFGGTNYYCYYALVVDVSSGGDPVIEHIDMTGGAPGVVTPFVPAAQQQNPVPVSMTNGVVNTSTGEHINVYTPLEVILDATAIANIIDACKIIYNDERYAVISEVGICSGLDKDVTSTAGGNTVTYTEALAMTMCHAISARANLQHNSSSVTLKYRLASSQPLLT